MPSLDIIPWQDKFLDSNYIRYQFVDELGRPTATPSNPSFSHIDEVPEGLDPSYIDIYPRLDVVSAQRCNLDYRVKTRTGLWPIDFDGADSVDIYFRYTGKQYAADNGFQAAIYTGSGPIIAGFGSVLPTNTDPNFIYKLRLTSLDPPGTGTNTGAMWADSPFIEIDIHPDIDLPAHPYFRVYSFIYRVKYTSSYDFGTAWWLLGES